MSKFNIGDQVIAQKDAPYYITTDGWKGEVVETGANYIRVRGPGMGGHDIGEYAVSPDYFDHANGFVPFGDLTEAQQGALLLAEHNGYMIQCRGDATENWGDITWGPSWDEETQYRVRPDAAAEQKAQLKAQLDLDEHKAKVAALNEELAALE